MASHNKHPIYSRISPPERSVPLQYIFSSISLKFLQSDVQAAVKAVEGEGLADGISIKSCGMRRLWGHGEPRLCRSAHLRIFFPLPVSSHSLSVARRGKPRTLDPQPARSGRLLQSHTLMERRRGERLGRRGKGGERGTFSRLSEHPTAAAAVSQTRRRGHPPSGGKRRNKEVEVKESERDRETGRD